MDQQIGFQQKALTAEEPITLTLVPDNYPVILPSGESTLSDKVKPEDLEVKTVEEPITISLVPSNYPVVLPSGVSTLSDQVKPEDLVINIFTCHRFQKKTKNFTT